MIALRLATAIYAIFTLRSLTSAQNFDKTAGEDFAAIVDRLTCNQLALRQFCWKMHTEVSVNGRIRQIGDDLCRYGPDPPATG